MRALILALVLTLAAIFRFSGLNWDQGKMLHPDERFLWMALGELQLPDSVGEYLSPHSVYNPYNNKKFGQFVYGQLPLTIAKLVVLGFDFSRDEHHLVCRVLSGVFDLGTLVILFLIAISLERRYRLSRGVSLLAPFFYGCAVFPIQQSHFFVVDSFLVFFVLSGVYFSYLFFEAPGQRALLLSAALFGLAFGTKISAVYFLPIPILLVLFSKGPFWERALSLLSFLFCAYLFFRISDPKTFLNDNLFDPRFSQRFLANISTLKSVSQPETFFPPAVQWISTTPVIFPLKNLVVFGLGPVLALLSLLGMLLVLKERRWILVFLLVYSLSFSIYQGSQFVKTMRYFYPLYPWLALFAGFGAMALVDWAPRKYRSLLFSLVLLGVVVWPASFINIYLTSHPRIEASEWIYKNIPKEAILIEEAWDDRLPVRCPAYSFEYSIIQMPVYMADDPKKWSGINEMLKTGQYLVLSSARASGAISSVPRKYPQMSEFYIKLNSGEAGFSKVAEFSSRPTLWLGQVKFTFDDSGAEEAFTVYDHPTVTIYRKDV